MALSILFIRVLPAIRSSIDAALDALGLVEPGKEVIFEPLEKLFQLFLIVLDPLDLKRHQGESNRLYYLVLVDEHFLNIALYRMLKLLLLQNVGSYIYFSFFVNQLIHSEDEFSPQLPQFFNFFLSLRVLYNALLKQALSAFKELALTLKWNPTLLISPFKLQGSST